jgi:RND family efflux transporter MFP subunit
MALCVPAGAEVPDASRPGSSASTTLVIDGLTLPSRQVELAFPVPGILTSRPVEVGQFIPEGRLVAELNTELERAGVRISRLKAEAPHELRSAEVDEVLKKEDFERKQDLSRRDSVSPWELRQAELAYELARARTQVVRSQQRVFEEQLARDEALLTQRQAKAPFSGWIWRLYKEPGEAVDALEPVVRLVALDPLWVEVNVPAEHAGRVEPGDEVVVTALGRVRNGVVGSVEPVVDVGSGTFQVRIVVPNGDAAMVAGVPATATIGLWDGPRPANGIEARAHPPVIVNGQP